MDKERIPLLEMYKEWLVISKPSTYVSKIRNCSSKNQDYPKYLLILGNLLYYGRTTDVSLLAYIPAILSKVEEEFKHKNRSYFRKFQEFINTVQEDKQNSLNRLKSDDNIYDSLKSMNIPKNEIKLDAMDFLIQELGEDLFIKKTIESSLFFSWDLVKDRHESIARAFKLGLYIPVRKGKTINIKDVSQEQIKEMNLIQSKSDRRKALKIGEFMNWNVFIDAFGNDEVIKLITEKTGYVLARGQKKSNLPNYIISHVWGNAGDPRFFTNLWNVVLIPAWANFLMDKNTTETNSSDEEVQNVVFAGNIASKLKCTIMEVCRQLYNDLKNLDWNTMNMPCPAPPKDTTDIIKGEYHIKVIHEKKEKIVGSISTVNIQIK